MGNLRESEGRLGRRKFLAGGALATAGVAHAATGTALAAGSRSRAKGRHGVLPAPRPIPGGIEFGQFIHVFIPGPEGVVLPFTGTPLMGFDVEPSTITDFRGRVALAYLLGTAETTDGPQDLEVDVRVMQGNYVAENGEKRFGTFAEF